jgi:hypothetical protein
MTSFEGALQGVLAAVSDAFGRDPPPSDAAFLAAALPDGLGAADRNSVVEVALRMHLNSRLAEKQVRRD